MSYQPIEVDSRGNALLIWPGYEQVKVRPVADKWGDILIEFHGLPMYLPREDAEVLIAELTDAVSGAAAKSVTAA